MGTQYRSAIFFHTPAQKRIAEESKAKIQQAQTTDQIVTEITPFTHFYPAESYHQNYFDKNQGAPYCNFVISPKIHKLLELYGDQIKVEYR